MVGSFPKDLNTSGYDKTRAFPNGLPQWVIPALRQSWPVSPQNDQDEAIHRGLVTGEVARTAPKTASLARNGTRPVWCPNPDAGALVLPGCKRVRAKGAGDADSLGQLAAPVPVANNLEIAFHPTSQVLRPNFCTLGRERSRPRCGSNSVTVTFDPAWISIPKLETRRAREDEPGHKLHPRLG